MAISSDSNEHADKLSKRNAFFINWVRSIANMWMPIETNDEIIRTNALLVWKCIEIILKSKSIGHLFFQKINLIHWNQRIELWNNFFHNFTIFHTNSMEIMQFTNRWCSCDAICNHKSSNSHVYIHPETVE